MRTVKVTLFNKIDATGSLELATEVIVEEGDEQQAGEDAKQALDRFIAGYANG
jgi:hypothetical protein